MRVVFAVLILLCSKSFATALDGANLNTTAATANVDLNQKISNWSLEGAIQAQSVAGPGSPWIGLAAARKIVNAVSLGFRGFLPLSQTVDNSSYSIQSFLRVRAVHGENTDFFFEPDVAINFYNLVPFKSYGVAVGAMNRIKPDLSIGIMGGVEFANVVIDSIGVEDRNDLIVYPKIALVTDFTF